MNRDRERSHFWNQFSSWEEAEDAWDGQAAQSKRRCPLQCHSFSPKIPFLVPGQEKWLRWKGVRWLLFRKGGFRFIKSFLFHPVRYLFRYLRSLCIKSCIDGDYFFYGISSLPEFEQLFKDSILLVGFSYCQKPMECPSGRFSDACMADLSSPFCQQCVIGKAKHVAQNASIVIIPTVRDIGETILDLSERYPNRRILFLITTCELAMRMFGNFADALGVRGVGIRLHGRICNTKKAFELSERGIKPGLTLLAQEPEQRLFSLLKLWREAEAKEEDGKTIGSYV